MELDIKCTETGHCKRTFGIRHSMEFGRGPLEIGITKKMEGVTKMCVLMKRNVKKIMIVK